MANIQKYSDLKDIGHLCKHYERSAENYSNTKIDKERTEKNYNLAPERVGKQTDYIKEKIKEIELSNGKTLRKDAVKMVTCIVDAPKNIDKKNIEKFFQLSYRFLVQRYGSKSGLGEDIVVSAYVHNDENTPHLHFAFLPIIKKKGTLTFCAKDMINRQDLRTLHQDLGEFLESRNICRKSDILNGSTIKDSNGKAVSVNQLKKEKYLRERDGRWNRNRERTFDRESRW